MAERGHARTAAVHLPDKLYFKIGEVADLVGVKAHVLRYWEREFSILKPAKTKSHHRLYRRKDVETLLQIKQLLHNERFTIAGARQRIKAAPATAKAGSRPPLSPAGRTYRSALVRIKKDLEALHRMLS